MEEGAEAGAAAVSDNPRTEAWVTRAEAGTWETVGAAEVGRKTVVGSADAGAWRSDGAAASG